jgi:DNA (cytosine-5)-methyltransferase 1
VGRDLSRLVGGHGADDNRLVPHFRHLFQPNPNELRTFRLLLGRESANLAKNDTAADSGGWVVADGSSSEFRTLRERAGLSLECAAALIEVSPRTAYRYENGESRPTKLAITTLRSAASVPRPEAAAPPGFTFIDLFAGIGGLRRPFENIGGKCVFTCEWDEFSRKTYGANFTVDHEFGYDIRDYAQDPGKVAAHDVLLAGFPCQPFSLAGVSKKNALGRPHGFLCDTQGTLFFDLAQIIAHHRPKAFLLENVKHLEGHDQGRTFATILNVLRNELKYDLHYRVISSEPWVPQKRERIFIVGFQEPKPFSFDQVKVPRAEGRKLASILEPQVDAKYTLTAHLWRYLKEYKKKHTSMGNGFGYSLFGPDDVTRTLSARYFKDGSEILIAQNGGRPRRLTPRECSRLMGFDTPRGSSFKIPVSDTQAYRQFGNAVVVPVVQAVADAMRPYIEEAVLPTEENAAQLQYA